MGKSQFNGEEKFNDGETYQISKVSSFQKVTGSKTRNIEDKGNNRFYINESFEDIEAAIKLSEKFYENSFYSIKEIPISFRFSILVARRVYRKIGYKILNKKNLENYKNSGKIYVSNIEKIIETLLSIFDLIKLSFISKNDDNIEHDHNLIYEEINLNERI